MRAKRAIPFEPGVPQITLVAGPDTNVTCQTYNAGFGRSGPPCGEGSRKTSASSRSRPLLRVAEILALPRVACVSESRHAGMQDRFTTQKRQSR
jgi:hypothetical protein